MSYAGMCPRALSATLMDYETKEPPDWLIDSAEEGHWHEVRIKNELRASNWFVENEQKEVIIEQPNYTLKGHIDGMAVEDGEWSCCHSHEHMPAWKLLEVKSMSQFEYDRWLRELFDGFPKYKAQITLYMEALEIDKCLYIVKNRNNGQKDYNAGKGKNGILEFVEKPMNPQEVYDNVDLAVTSANNEQLALAEFDPSTWECKRCQFTKYCIPQPQSLSKENQLILEKACQQWRLSKILIEKGEADKTEAELILNSFNPEQSKYIFDELAITRSHIKYNNYDKKLLEATFQPEQLLPAIKPVEYDRMLVTDLRNKKKKRDNSND